MDIAAQDLAPDSFDLRDPYLTLPAAPSKFLPGLQPKLLEA
jgi:hypothetical protein